MYSQKQLKVARDSCDVTHSLTQASIHTSHVNGSKSFTKYSLHLVQSTEQNTGELYYRLQQKQKKKLEWIWYGDVSERTWTTTKRTKERETRVTGLTWWQFMFLLFNDAHTSYNQPADKQCHNVVRSKVLIVRSCSILMLRYCKKEWSTGVKMWLNCLVYQNEPGDIWLFFANPFL